MDTPEKGDKGEDVGGFERTEEKTELIDLSCGLRTPWFRTSTLGAALVV
jgi:hypothetical protein